MTTLTPSTEDEAAGMIRAARSRREPLMFQGGGTRAGLGRPVEAATILSSRGLDGITLHEPAELVIAAGAGTPLRDVEEKLAAAGQILPFEPVDLRALYGSTGEPTVGGVVAGNWSGPRRVAAGAARDHLIGVRFVNGRGEVVKSGGRVMKNVTGLDLVKLQCGAHGTLGFLTEVTFKVLPRAESAATLVFPGLDDARAVALLTAALTSPFEVSGAAHLPAGLSRSSPEPARDDRASPSPLVGEGPAQPGMRGRETLDGARDPSSGAARHLLPQGEKGRPGTRSLQGDVDVAWTCLRLENLGASVDYRCGRLEDLLAGFGRPTRLGDDATATLWADIRDARVLAEPRERAIWRLSVPPNAGPDVVARLPPGLAAAHFYDWGGGLVWLAVEVRGDAGAEVRGDAGAAAIRAALRPDGGHATLIRAPDSLRASVAVFEPLAPPLQALTRGLKASVDPDLILNPGRMYADA